MKSSHARLRQPVSTLTLVTPAQLRALIDGGQDAIALGEADGTLRFVSPSIQRLIGYPPGDLVGCVAFDLLHPDDQGYARGVFGELLRQPGMPVHLEARVRHRDDGWRQVELVAVNRLRERAVRAVIISFTDVTQQRQMEALVARSAALVESSDDAVVGASADGRITSWNGGAERLFGYAPVEVIGRPGAILVPPQCLGDVQTLQARLRAGERVAPFETVRLAKDGTALDVAATAVPVKAPSGAIVGFAIVFRNIAERLRGELALATLLEEERHLRAELETLSRRLVQVRETEQRSLARELHDEVGQLLTGLHLMLEEVGSVIRPEALRLVRDLQQRIRAITLDLRPPMLDELGLVAALRWFFERYTARTCIRVAFTLKGEDRRLTHEMESGAFRIIQEALTNTARHGSVKAILVSVEFAPQRLRVSIADGGKGFDLKNARQGASTGLAGMRERARLLGGDIVIDSAPGQGTRVEVDLPLRGPVGAW